MRKPRATADNPGSELISVFRVPVRGSGVNEEMSDFSHMRVLAVDDNTANLELLRLTLEQGGYRNVVASQDPRAALRLCDAWKPDALLLDLDMVNPSGFQVLSEIRELTLEPESLPVLALTGETGRQERERALGLGVRDFIRKPVEVTELMPRLTNALHTRHLQRRLQAGREAINQAVRDRTVELEQMRLESLTILASIAEYHDDDVQPHTQRVGLLAAKIAEAMELPDQFVAAIRDAAPLHDLGKIGIPRAILLKPGTLTAYEREHMMRHVEIGAQILGAARSPVLRLAGEIARTHHERWDGSGYVAGLTHNEIPLSGRIVAVADVFDALTHARPYKPAWDMGRALTEMHAKAGRQFDPRVMEAFMAVDLHAVYGQTQRAPAQSAA
jgi:putative two-component system response regulator